MTMALLETRTTISVGTSGPGEMVLADVIPLRKGTYTWGMTDSSHHRGRVLATLCVAAAHVYLSVLGFTGYLSYTSPTKYEVLAQVAAQDTWAWVHAGVALLFFVTLARPHFRPAIGKHTSYLTSIALACNIGFALMFSWAFFHLLWGLTVERPVSLAGPGLAFAVALGEQLLANAWTRGTHDKGR